MIDVIHFIYEQDTVHTSEESIASQSGVRVALYRDLYGTTYKYPYTPKKQKTQSTSPGLGTLDGSDLGALDDAESLKPFSPAEMEPERKPTMGAETITQFDPDSDDPFGGVLDRPAG